MKTILILAFDVSPYRGSEASISWNYLINMMHSNHLIVLYGKGKSEIEDYLKNNTMPNVSFYNIDCMSQSYDMGLLYDIKYNLDYRNWHKKVYKSAKELIEKEQIDVIHYLGPGGFKEPGYLWKLNKPYIWGPILGVENRPFKLYKALSFRGKINALTRRIIHNGMFRFMPRLRKAIKRCDYIFSITTNTQKQLSTIYHKNSYYLPEHGILQMEANQPLHYEKDNILNLIWVGTLCERKALIILIDALAKIKDMPFCLNVVGTGPLDEKLKHSSAQKGLSNKIIWHGHVSRNQVQEIFSTAHLHIISSLGESTTTVLFEAMSKGIPTMTLDHCGMSRVVCEKCGIRIPIKSYRYVVNDIASNLVSLIRDPEKLTRLSVETIECAKKYTWDKRVTVFNKSYETAIKNYQNRT